MEGSEAATSVDNPRLNLIADHPAVLAKLGSMMSRLRESSGGKAQTQLTVLYLNSTMPHLELHMPLFSMNQVMTLDATTSWQFLRLLCAN